MLKRRARRAIDGLARATGALWWMESRMRGSLTVLMYHRVLPAQRTLEYAQPSLAMPVEFFGRQAAWLARHCDVLPLGEALERQAAGARRSMPLVAITFDDGYVDNHDLAAPVLDALRIRATFFVTTDFVEGQSLWYDRATSLLSAAETTAIEGWRSRLGPDVPRVENTLHEVRTCLELLKACAPLEREVRLDELASLVSAPAPLADDKAMSIDQLRSLQASGHEIGSHTLSHPILPQLDDAALAHELGESRERLCEWLGVPVVGLAYPNGDCDERVSAAARAAGYKFATTTKPGALRTEFDPLQIPRRDITARRVSDHMGRHDELAFRCEIASIHDLMR